MTELLRSLWSRSRRMAARAARGSRRRAIVLWRKGQRGLVTRRYARYSAGEGVDEREVFAAVAANYADRANPFHYYVELVRRLAEIPGLTLRPMRDLARWSGSAEMRRNAPRIVGLRHDVDADPITAVRCARALARVGLAGTFYLLHTAPYYGRFADGHFTRNAMLRTWILELIVAGSEIGLHHDALGVCQQWGLDGIAALEAELRFLRDQSAHIDGVVGHNSFAAYGAENFEVFRELAFRQQAVDDDRRRHLPLAAVSLGELGLKYEGSFPGRRRFPAHGAVAVEAPGADVGTDSATWMRRYLLDHPVCRWEVSTCFWLLGPNRWVVAGQRGRDELFEWQVGLDDVIRLAADLPSDSRSVFVVHPVLVRA